MQFTEKIPRYLNSPNFFPNAAEIPNLGTNSPKIFPGVKYPRKQNLFQINSEIIISRMFVQWIVVRGGTGSGLPESIPAGFCIFLTDPDPDTESKICEKPDPYRSHFSISAEAGVCAVIFQVKTWVNYVWVDCCSRSLNRSRILKFEE